MVSVGMSGEKRFLEDVGMEGLPFPMKVISKVDPEGQPTVASISINARIMQGFEARWIDKFIQILHRHRDMIGTKTLRANIIDYMKELNATMVRIDFDYPFFIEKLTPASKEKCLVRYLCTYSAKATASEKRPKIILKIRAPIISTYPGSAREKPGGLFGQLSVVVVEVESAEEICPEDIVDIVDKHALSPVYSFLTEADQNFIIEKVHSQEKSSVATTDEIKDELARKHCIDWFSVRCYNYGMLHSYSTVIGTEKSAGVPFTVFEEEI